ncbi:TetR/AcrR family transcriptional regulator [Bradyrhizobium sp. S69]|uniref:TetR/AcrR family transcriptional regulator n=1 Tax=Bradyrhizobium sp. S69 TaxID=1641856 RepID=UPI001FEEEB05|nr:TetR/AcrR family transcriptional regulator [Bradyrhizobium sp. S69]
MIVPYIAVMIKMVTAGSHAAPVRGRPREFDMEEALDGAIRVFRERGYHASSIGDLTDAMGLASGSIYKAFKDKRDIFLAAFDRYTLLRTAQMQQVAGAAKSARERLRDLFAFYLESSRGVEGRRGCLVVGSAVELAIFDREVAARVGASLANNEALLAGLVREGHLDSSVPRGVDPEETARVMVYLTQGMRVVGKAGRAPPDPSITIEIAMKLLT